MNFVVYDDNMGFIGVFNEYNVFFIDNKLKNNFLKVYYSDGFDSAVQWLKESGYVVEVVK